MHKNMGEINKTARNLWIIVQQKRKSGRILYISRYQYKIRKEYHYEGVLR